MEPKDPPPGQLVHTSMHLCAQVVDPELCAINHMIEFCKRYHERLDTRPHVQPDRHPIARPAPPSSQERCPLVSRRKPTGPHRLPVSQPHPRAVLCSTLPLLCALALSSCGMSGTASTDASPAAQEASTASHSAAPSMPGDGQKSSAAPPQTASASPSEPTPTTQTSSGSRACRST